MLHDEHMNATALSPHELRMIAVAACADPRTVRKFIAGKAVAPTVQWRIVEAMKAAGIPLPGEAAE